MATTICKFSKLFRGACARTPLEPFLFSIRFKIIMHGKNTLETMTNLGAPSLKKFLEYVVDMKTFLKDSSALLRTANPG